LGGFNRVNNNSQWKTVYDKMGLPSTNGNSGVTQLKAAYKRHLQSFEDFNRKLGCTLASPRGARNRHTSARSLVRGTDKARLFTETMLRRSSSSLSALTGQQQQPRETRGRKPNNNKGKTLGGVDSGAPTPSPSPSLASSVGTNEDAKPPGTPTHAPRGDEEEPGPKKRGRKKGTVLGKKPLERQNSASSTTPVGAQTPDKPATPTPTPTPRERAMRPPSSSGGDEPDKFPPRPTSTNAAANSSSSRKSSLVPSESAKSSEKAAGSDLDSDWEFGEDMQKVRKAPPAMITRRPSSTSLEEKSTPVKKADLKEEEKESEVKREVSG
jgi:Ras-related protein Rab-1A